MMFLNPLLLLGLAAAAIPLIIHLFNFRRPRRVDFSSLTFVKELQKSTMQRVRIKQWLLLALRMLAIACLVLAFARPTLTGGVGSLLGGTAPTSFVVAVDNSLSMTLRDGQGQYLAQAKRIAAGLIDQTEAEDEVFVLAAADAPEERPAAFSNRNAALDAVAAIEASPAAAAASRLLGRAADVLGEARHLNREIYLISDLQRSTLVDSLAATLPEDVHVILLPVGDQAYANVAVTDVQVASRIVEEGQPVRVEATLENFGTETLDDYVASVFLEDTRVAQATADLAPGAATQVTFTITPQRRGWLAGTVQGEDDAFAQDNTRYFTLHVPERRRLLVVSGTEERTDYVELALSPRLTEGRVAFDLETIPETSFAAASLGSYDAVILVGPRTLSSGEIAALESYVEAGGGLLLFPGAAAQAPDYNALLTQLGGGAFSGFSGTLGAGRAIAAFDQTDLEHPLFEGMFGETVGGGETPRLETPEIFYAMNYSPGSGNEQTLIQLSNGFPFLQEIRHGRGAALLMAVAPDVRWSDLPVRGLFVPLLYRTVYYLASGESVAGEQLNVGQPGELRLTGVPEDATLRLVSPDGEERAPEQRRLFGALLLQVGGSVNTPGVYDVRNDAQLVRRVAFNLAPEESDLRSVEPEQARERLAEATGATVRLLDIAEGGAERIVQVVNQERTGVELWNVCLLLALAFLVAEMSVARRWRPEAVAA